jgi:glycosyltransferase involved in cell wall biosynthesis
MKILLSAYACEPNKGSEPGVGWNWAIEIARLGHEVWVLTRTNNRQTIELELSRQLRQSNLHFIYYDLPYWLRFWKQGLKGVHLYYFLWQIGAFVKAHALCRHIKFDFVHHVTFVSARQPSFMGLLGIPFIFGPLAGGERIPKQLRRQLSLQGLFFECFRDILNALVAFDPLMWLSFNQAKVIYVTSFNTLQLIPKYFHDKVKIQLAIGAELQKEDFQINALKQNELKILYVGHLLYLKGLHLGIEAFSRFLKTHPASRLTIIGEGIDKDWLKRKIEYYGIASSVDWLPWMKQEQLAAYYKAHDIFLFPSLRDSGGMVVLEALSFGLPVICLNLGGPGVIVDSTCGFKIEAENQNETIVIEGLVNAMELYCRLKSSEKQQLQAGAKARVQCFTWQQAVKNVYTSL